MSERTDTERLDWLADNHVYARTWPMGKKIGQYREHWLQYDYENLSADRTLRDEIDAAMAKVPA